MAAESSATRPRTQKQRSEESAKRILSATIELIAEKGFDRTTVAEIGNRAGYSRAMVHERYGSKEKLLDALLNSTFARVLPRPDADASTGMAAILAHIDALATLARDDPTTLRACYVLLYETAGPFRGLKSWSSDSLAAYRRSIEGALRRGQDDGTIRADLMPEAAARQVTTYLIGCGVQWSLDPRGTDLQGDLAGLRERLAKRWPPRATGF